jgi:hypothetical protein
MVAFSARPVIRIRAGAASLDSTRP